MSKIWLAANYHLPITYSCRMPLSSPHSAQCLPAPGPATVRLALMRTSIELFGVTQTRNILFPVIRDTDVAIRPPYRIGISSQTLLSYKATKRGLVTSIGYREFANTKDRLTIFIEVPAPLQKIFAKLLSAVGYWGQASSLAYCTSIYEAQPDIHEVIRPLKDGTDIHLGNLFTAFVTDWRREGVAWEVITGEESVSFLEHRLYVFPLEICEQRSSGQLLVFRSLEVEMKKT